MRLCRDFMLKVWRGQGAFQVQITALDLQPDDGQADLFAPDHRRRDQLNHAMDAINRRYGEFALAPARLLLRSKMPNVIAPAWKPFGHRETILG